MAQQHVIDAFVVELGLDPSKFDQVKNRFLQSLKDMEDKANRLERNVGRGRTSSAGRLAEGLSQINHPILTAINQLDQLSEAAYKSGSGVARGVGLGAAGLSRLTSAGLLAYGALKAVQSLTDKIQNQVSGLMTAGRNAAIGGFNSQWASAAGIALSERSGYNVREQTSAWLASVRQGLEDLKKGNTGIIERFKFLPGTIDTSTTMEEILLRVIEAARGMGSDAEAYSRLKDTGISPELAMAMRQMGGRTAMIAAIGKALDAAITPNQIKAANDLAEATQRLGSQFNALTHSMIELADGPLVKIFNDITETLKTARENPTKLITDPQSPVRRWLQGMLFGGFGYTKDMPYSTFPKGFKPPAPSAPDDRPWWQRAMDYITGQDSRGPSAYAPIPPSSATSSDRQYYTGEASAYAAEHGGFNFAGIRGPKNGFRTYPNEYSGVADTARLLQVYQQKHGINTLEGIINRWAPPSDNNPTEELIQRAERITGYKRSQALDLSDPVVMEKVLDAMNRNEFGGKSTVTSENLHAHVQRYFSELGAVGDSSKILGPYATGNAIIGGASSVAGVNPEFARRIDQMVKNMPPDIRQKFSIMSGYRSRARQAQVHPSVRDSYHSYGMAVDTTTDSDVVNWINQNGALYGVGYPLNSDPKERNHLEPLENGQRVRDRLAWLKQFSPIGAAAAAQRSAAEQRAGIGANTANDNSTSYANDFRVGAINVYSAGGTLNGYALGGTIGDSLKREMLTNNVNTGLY